MTSPQASHSSCSHDHGIGHSHHHGDPADHSRAFVIAILLNSVFVVTEFAYGFIADSTALMADAGHNLSDVLGLILAWGAVSLAQKAPNARYTYGLRNSTILAALANAIILLFACGGIAWEAISRFAAPPEVAGATVTTVAGIGIIINSLSAWLFMKGSKHDLNIRGAYLHMAADAAVSLGVMVAGLVMMKTGWYWLDPVFSLVIVAVILFSTWRLLKESLALAMAAVPASIDAASVTDYLKAQTGVSDVHDLHIWGLSTTESALTVHLVMPDGHPGDVFIDTVTSGLNSRFAISHATLQIENGTTEHTCSLIPKGKSAHPGWERA
ncbi:cation diffusion facilitator family transporter [Kordiimonas marina]|uniref:cation diffusion facilitator family transporter n=1 Tax=Kordiimonas marina TaxID=2872312 RepID=UPI001FF6A626|nr:cation diffusion facilitator family transporter [Kordiimonas marina]MCJ9429450.1 cation diffusion facilitator family transporter [Kordiimonas marina]